MGTGRLLGRRRAGTPTPPGWTDSNLAPRRPSKAAAWAAPASLLPQPSAQITGPVERERSQGRQAVWNSTRGREAGRQGGRRWPASLHVVHGTHRCYYCRYLAFR